MKYKHAFLLLFLSITLTACFEFGPKGKQNPIVTKRDFQTIWRLNTIRIDGKRNGENTTRSFTGATFQDKDGNFGYARIEFRTNGRFVANIHINSEETGPIDETIEGDAFFSSGTMYTDAPGRLEWDRLAFKINLEDKLFVELKNYETDKGGPFDSFYDHHTVSKDSIGLTFLEYNN